MCRNDVVIHESGNTPRIVICGTLDRAGRTRECYVCRPYDHTLDIGWERDRCGQRTDLPRVGAGDGQ